MIAGGLICTLGAVGCALTPSIGLLIVFRVVQGFGGGVAAVVAQRCRRVSPGGLPGTSHIVSEPEPMFR
jgi:MFS family permease